MKANWNGRHFGWTDSGGLPLHHPLSAFAGRRHCPIGDPKGFEALRIIQQLDALFDALRGDLGAVQQFGRRSLRGGAATWVPSSVVASIQVVYCVTKLPSLALAAAPSASCCEGIHRQLDVFQVRRCNPLDLRFGNPAGADGVALAVSQNCLGGDAVPDGILARIAILQVGDSFVPVVAFQAAQIRTRNEPFFAA